MDREYITSMMIRSIGHDASSSVLEIEFCSGPIWQYFDFTESDWHSFCAAESKGKYFLANIKNKYRECRV